jgi:multicomponent Na+:H+ antiporter subunit E
VNAFLLNILLAGIWAALVGEVDTPHLVFGFLLGYAVLWTMRPIIGSEYHRKLPMFVSFLTFFLGELVLSTVRVAWEVITPDRKRRPGIIVLPLDARTETEIAVLANLITLTPGTLSLAPS